MTKKIFVAIALCVLVISPAFAEENTTADEVATIVDTETVASTDAGVLPNSIWYSFDQLGEWVSSLFTFDVGSQATQYLDFASERLAEANALADLEDEDQEEIQESMDYALNAYNEEMQNLDELMQEIDVGLEEDLGDDWAGFSEEVARAQILQQDALGDLENLNFEENSKELVQGLRESSFGIARGVIEKFVPSDLVDDVFVESIEDLDEEGEIESEDAFDDMDDFFGEDFMSDFKAEMEAFGQEMEDFDPFEGSDFGEMETETNQIQNQGEDTQAQTQNNESNQNGLQE